MAKRMMTADGRLGVLLVAVAALVMACSSGTGAGSSAAATAGASTGTSTGGGRYGDYDDDVVVGGPTSAPAGPVTLTAATGAAGPYLTGAGGMTLYVFHRDSNGTSACDASCAAAWPPLTVDPGTTPAVADGVTGTLTTFTRDDGTTQVAYDGAPLYYFSGDKAAGDMKGDGQGDVWFVAAP